MTLGCNGQAKVQIGLSSGLIGYYYISHSFLINFAMGTQLLPQKIGALD
jgi:hypothetical protein